MLSTRKTRIREVTLKTYRFRRVDKFVGDFHPARVQRMLPLDYTSKIEGQNFSQG